MIRASCEILGGNLQSEKWRMPGMGQDALEDLLRRQGTAGMLLGAGL